MAKYRLEYFNNQSFILNGKSYTNNYQLTKSLEGFIRLVNIYDHRDELFSNAFLEDITINKVRYLSWQSLQIGFEPLKKVDSSAGNTASVVEKLDEVLQAIKSSIYTKEHLVDIVLESGANVPIEVPFSELMEGKLYDIAIAGIPSGLSYSYKINNGVIIIELSNLTANTIEMNNTITITAKLQ